LRRVLLILFVLFAVAFSASGRSIAGANGSGKGSPPPIYRYVDRNGVEVFTDDLSRVPAEYRSSAKAVELPPEIKMPEPLSASQPAASFSARVREWVGRQPPGYRLILVGVLPVLVVSLWGLSFLRKRSESAFVKISLRLGMMAIVILSAYLCYFIFIRVQAESLNGDVSEGSESISSTRQKAEELKKEEAGRLKAIEDITNQK